MYIYSTCNIYNVHVSYYILDHIIYIMHMFYMLHMSVCVTLKDFSAIFRPGDFIQKYFRHHRAWGCDDCGGHPFQETSTSACL